MSCSSSGIVESARSSLEHVSRSRLVQKLELVVSIFQMLVITAATNCARTLKLDVRSSQYVSTAKARLHTDGNCKANLRLTRHLAED